MEERIGLEKWKFGGFDSPRDDKHEEEVNEITKEWERGFVKEEGKMNSSISWHLRRASGFRDSPRQPVGRSITTGMRSLALKVISSRARDRKPRRP